MKISIAMATYNGAAFLRAQLDSFAAQTLPPDEIVISDDGSKDATLDIVRDWAAHHPGLGVRLLDGSGPGNFAHNFARAFLATTGDLVFPSDQDDVWLPEKIAYMTNFMEQNPDTMVAIHDLEITDSDLNPIGQRKMSRTRSLGGPMRDYNSGMATVVRGPFLHCCAVPPPGFSHDTWIHLCARELGAKRLVEIPLALFRRHGGAFTEGMLLNNPHRRSNLAMRLDYIRLVTSRDKGGLDLERQLEKTNQTEDWLSSQKSALVAAGVSSAAIADLETSLARMKDLTESRRSIRMRHRLGRIGPILRMARSGGCRAFNGTAAAFKDFFL